MDWSEAWLIGGKSAPNADLDFEGSHGKRRKLHVLGVGDNAAETDTVTGLITPDSTIATYNRHERERERERGSN